MLVVVKIGPCETVVAGAVVFYLISSSLLVREITDIIQEVIDLVNTSLESCSGLRDDSGMSIGFGLLVEGSSDLVECALGISVRVSLSLSAEKYAMTTNGG